MLYIGVDPGKSGAIAAVSEGEALLFPTPDEEAIKAACIVLKALRHHMFAAVERVHAFPGQGVVSSFTFGQSYGAVRQGLLDNGIFIRDVQPKTWMKHFDLPSVKVAGGNTQKKNAHKALASKLFPTVKVTHAVADALLIALWNLDTHK